MTMVIFVNVKIIYIRITDGDGTFQANHRHTRYKQRSVDFDKKGICFKNIFF